MTEEQMLARIAQLETSLTKPAVQRKQRIPRMHITCGSCHLPLKNLKQQRKHDDYHRGRLHLTLGR